ncbi:MAG: EthD family reductase [Gemmatimonadales bacterium]
MPRSVLIGPLAALVVVAGCSKPASQRQAEATTPGVGWVVQVLYNQPTDTAAFEKYYAETHIPLFKSHAQEIGVTRVELIRFAAGADGKAPSLYREADLRWESKEAMDRGMATAGFKAVAEDLPRFATGGFTVLVAQKTN